MSEYSQAKMADKASFSESEAVAWDQAAERDEELDRKLAEKTRAVARTLRDRAAYIKSRLDAY